MAANRFQDKDSLREFRGTQKEPEGRPGQENQGEVKELGETPLGGYLKARAL